jgi:DNA-binding transcriptional MerR regulator/quercetin dioxygenase-like cupin family protein
VGSGGGVSGTGLLRIADAARSVGVSPSALRLWERQGLVTPLRNGGRERRYGPAELEQLHRVRRLRTEGLNAPGIRRVLGGGPNPDGQDRAVQHPAGRGGPAQDADGMRAVGRRLRMLRVAAGLPLREVAVRSGLSASSVSGLERGTSGASVAALVRLAAVFDTSVADLLRLRRTDESPGVPVGGAPQPAGQRVVRRDLRPSVRIGRGIRIEELAALATHLQPQIFVLAPGATSAGAYAHAGEEFMFVLAGRLGIWLDDREHHELGPGDALTFPSSLPHRFVALDDEETRILWVNTPPTF